MLLLINKAEHAQPIILFTLKPKANSTEHSKYCMSTCSPLAVDVGKTIFKVKCASYVIIIQLDSKRFLLTMLSGGQFLLATPIPLSDARLVFTAGIIINVIKRSRQLYIHS